MEASNLSQSKPINLTDEKIAIQGYDPVSYFTSEPNLGNSDITSTYEGGTYQFLNQENKALFDANPQKYVPQYGGFCAVAVSEGKLVPVDPKTYKITNDKLYLFYNGEHGNTKPQWEADEASRLRDADSHWKRGDLEKV